MTASLPLVSIIIPFWNSEQWLERSIQSALNQTWPRKELILVDDGSSDGSERIAKQYLGRTVRLIRQSNRGASSARNYGLNHSRGEYIQFLDADDELDARKIEIQIKKLIANQSILAPCTSRYSIVHPRHGTQQYPDRLWQDLTPVQWLQYSLTDSAAMPTSAWLSPRFLLDKAGRWDESLTLNDDGEYFARVVAASDCVLFSHDACWKYFAENESSLGSRTDLASLESLFRSIESTINSLLELDSSSASLHAASLLYGRLAKQSLNLQNDICQIAEKRAYELTGCPLSFESSFLKKCIERVVGWKTIAKVRRMGQRNQR